MKATQRFLKKLLDALGENNIDFVMDFLAGTNTRLYQEIDALRSSSAGSIRLHGYITDIARFMHSSDVLLSNLEA